MGIDLAVTPIVSKRDGDPCASFTVMGGLVVPVVMAPCKDRTLVPVQATDVTTVFMSVADRTPLNCGGTDSENRVLLGCDHSFDLPKRNFYVVRHVERYRSKVVDALVSMVSAVFTRPRKS